MESIETIFVGAGQTGLAASNLPNAASTSICAVPFVRSNPNVLKPKTTAKPKPAFLSKDMVALFV